MCRIVAPVVLVHVACPANYKLWELFFLIHKLTYAYWNHLKMRWVDVNPAASRRLMVWTIMGSE